MTAIILLAGGAYAGSGATRVVDCSAVFEQRKGELKLQLDAIAAEKENLEALKKAAASLQTAREKRIDAKAAEAAAALQAVTRKELSIQKLIDDNKKLLEQIKSAKDDKVVQMYLKMKPAASAAIMAEMDTAVCVGILAKMEPKKAGEILAKMDPKKASEITEALRK